MRLRSNKLFLLTIIFLISLSLFTGCSSSSNLKSQLSGEWISMYGFDEIEFDSNGNGAALSVNGLYTKETQFSYELNGNHITIKDKDTGNVTMTANVEISEEDGDEILTLSEVNYSNGKDSDPTTLVFKKYSDNTSDIEVSSNNDSNITDETDNLKVSNLAYYFDKNIEELISNYPEFELTFTYDSGRTEYRSETVLIETNPEGKIDYIYISAESPLEVSEDFNLYGIYPYQYFLKEAKPIIETLSKDIKTRDFGEHTKIYSVYLSDSKLLELDVSTSDEEYQYVLSMSLENNK